MTSTGISVLKHIFVETARSRTHLLCMISVIGLMGVSIYSNIAVPLYFKHIIDKLTASEFHLLGLILLGYGLLWMLSQISTQVREMLMSSLIERSKTLLGRRTFAHLYQLPHQYHLEQKTGALSNSIRRAQTSLPLILWATILHIIPLVLELMAVFFVLLNAYHLIYTLTLLLTLALYAVFTVLGSNIAVKQRALAIEAEKCVESKLIDWLAHLELVRIFGRSDSAVQDFCTRLKDRERSEIRVSQMSGWLRIGQAVIIGIGLSLMSWVLGQAVQTGTLSLGDFILFNTYFFQFIAPISVLGYVYKDTKKAILELYDVFAILDTQPICVGPENARCLTAESLEIEFRNVGFAYGAKEILRDVSFRVLPGQTAVLIGQTGQGKSTIFKLLLGIYEPTSGEILIGGVNIRNLSLHSLRQAIGFVPQDCALLDDSIEVNISFFDPQIALKDVQIAAQKAGLSQTIAALPKGFKTPVGERGVKLSGGERQRIVLARLFARNPKICLLDEPTSALDSDTEQLICRNLQKHFTETSKIIASHRSATIQRADQVIDLGAIQGRAPVCSAA